MNAIPEFSRKSPQLSPISESDLKLLTAQRLIVGIASYGDSHLDLLRKVIAKYRTFPTKTSIVVFSDGPKNLGADVEVIVGLPTRDPWSLPFAHKKTFSERINDFDLFIYTEDDIGIESAQIAAFFRATAELDSTEIAGFLRYERAPDGQTFLSEPWQHYHWVPESVRKRGKYTVAEFSNEHAAIYVLTQSQLKRAIESGGYLRAPYRARYDLACTAATDPYTSCGFTKVIPISHLDDFLVHHIPNKYINDLPVTYDEFQQQICVLNRIRDGELPAITLCDIEPRNWHNGYQKSFFEKPNSLLLDAIPRGNKCVLSVGAGWGAVESALLERGHRVTALPLDTVFGALLESRGIEVLYKKLTSGLAALSGRQFDCVLMTNLLHLQPEPKSLLLAIGRLVAAGGTFVSAGPNFNRLPRLLKRSLGIGNHAKLRTFEESGINTIGPLQICRDLRQIGFTHFDSWWMNESGKMLAELTSLPIGKSLVASHWIFKGTKLSAS